MLLYVLFSHVPLLAVRNEILESKMSCLFYSYKKYLIKEIWPPSNSLFNIHNPIGQKLIRWLEYDLSHLNRHRFNYNFDNCWSHFSPMFHFCTPFLYPIQILGLNGLSPQYISSAEYEPTLLHYHYHIPVRKIQFEELKRKFIKTLRFWYWI